ncbi:MAG: hypothetical protein EXS31_08065 [Pedosphaera sp.]|nr:hypothetical protein [Pedosphaera sp.]
MKTFSGKNPCKICIVVQEGKKSEEKRDSVKVETKLDLFITDRQLFWVQPAGESFEPSLVFSNPAPERFLPPPTPPPRAA